MKKLYTLLVLTAVCISANSINTVGKASKSKAESFKKSISKSPKVDGCTQTIDSVVEYDYQSKKPLLIDYATYDANGNLTFVIEHPFDDATNTWNTNIVNYTIENTYDENDNLLYNLRSELEDGVLVKNTGEEYTYDNKHREIKAIYHRNWSFEENKFLYKNQIETSYDVAGNISTETHSSWQNEQWQQTFLIERQYNDLGKIIKETESQFQEGSWVKQRESNFEYDEAGVLLRKLTTGFWGSSETFDKYEYTFDGRGNLIEENNSSGGDSGLVWTLMSKSVYTYDTNNNMLEEAYYYKRDLDVDVLFPSEKMVYTYNACGNQETFTNFEAPENDWVVTYYAVAYYSSGSTGIEINQGHESGIVSSKDGIVVNYTNLALVSIYAVNGQKVLQTANANIPTNNLNKGVYVVVATLTDGSRHAAKVVIK